MTSTPQCCENQRLIWVADNQVGCPDFQVCGNCHRIPIYPTTGDVETITKESLKNDQSLSDSATGDVEKRFDEKTWSRDWGIALRGLSEYQVNLANSLHVYAIQLAQLKELQRIVARIQAIKAENSDEQRMKEIVLDNLKAINE